MWRYAIVGNWHKKDPTILCDSEIVKSIGVAIYHGKRTKEELQKSLNFSTPEITSGIETMKEYKWLKESEEGKFILNFLPISYPEVKAVKDICPKFAEPIFDDIIKKWPMVKKVIHSLDVTRRFPENRIAFQVIGFYLLDEGLLDAFYQEGKIIPAPPKRKFSHYYLWMLEVSESPQYTIYGCNSARTGKKHKYWVYEFHNNKRAQKRTRCSVIPFPPKPVEIYEVWRSLHEYFNYYHGKKDHLMRKAREKLKEWYYLGAHDEPNAPIYSPTDAKKIENLIKEVTPAIIKIFQDNLDILEKAYTSTNAYKCCDSEQFHNFAVFCEHLVYSSVIDKLIEQKLIKPYEEGFDFWMSEE